jgi:uncharacterized pyridoxal phosphate-containing UPF0001 family protein
MSIRENLESVRKRIEKAASSVGRDPQEIKLIAAVKNVPTELVLQALDACQVASLLTTYICVVEY